MPIKSFEVRGETRSYMIVTTKEEADEYVTDEMIQDALEWFIDKRGVPTEEFLDRLTTDPAWDGSKPGVDFETFDDPGVKRVLSRARAIKREMDDYNA